MGWSAPYLTRPMSTDDLAAAFGITTSDLGTAIEQGSINMWATFKQVRYNSTDVLTRAQLQSVNFGLIPPPVRSTPDTTMTDRWEYGRPRGLSYNEQYRLLDADGYNRDALPPIRAVGDISITLSQQTTFAFTDYIVQNLAGGDAIAWQDLPDSGSGVNVGAFYLCVIFSTGPNLGGSLIAKTSSLTLSASGVSLALTNAELRQLMNNGYKYYYLVARSAQLSGLESPSANAASYIALPTSGGADDVRGAFTIQDTSLQNIIISHVSSIPSPTQAYQFFDATNFRGAESIPPVVSDYFLVSNAGNGYYIHFGLDITTGAASFSLSNLAVTLTQTFKSATGFTRLAYVTLKDSSFTTQSQITIPANTTARVYLVASVPLLSLLANGNEDQSVAPDQRFSMSVKFYANGSQLGSDEIRVRNYSW